MPVPTTEMVTPLRESSVLNVSSLSVREGVGVTALPRTTPLIDARDDADDGPIDDRAAFPPQAAAKRPTTASTAVPAVERIRCIQFLQVGNWRRSDRQLTYPTRDIADLLIQSEFRGERDRTRALQS